jgi:hypothetical protein
MFWGNHAWGVGPLDLCPHNAAVAEAFLDATLGP